MLRYPYRVATAIWVGLAILYVVVRVQSGATLGDVVRTGSGTVLVILAGFGIAHLTGYRPDLWPSRTARIFLLGVAVGGLAAMFTVVLIPFVMGAAWPGAVDAILSMTFLLIFTSCFLAIIGVLHIAQAVWREKPREPKPAAQEPALPPS